MAKEHTDRLAVIDEIKDEVRKRELRTEDENENFLDEGIYGFESFFGTLFYPYIQNIL